MSEAEDALRRIYAARTISDARDIVVATLANGILREGSQRTPEGLEVKPVSELLARFMAKVRKTDSGCWEWTAGKRGRGYGTIKVNGRMQAAHRVSMGLHGKEIPDGSVVDHVCRNPACVNPEHLRAVDQRTNVHENSEAPGRLNALKTHCPQGHEYAGRNLILKKDQRVCRECKNEAQRRRRARPEGARPEESAQPAAPAVQPEPVAWQERQQKSSNEWGPWYEIATPTRPDRMGSFVVGGIGYERRPLYAAPAVQPAPEPPEGWKPIDTAPIDDPEQAPLHAIVAAPLDSGILFLEEAWYDEHRNEWWPANVDHFDQHGQALYPTHWMPLPQPPALAAAPVVPGADEELSKEGT